MRLDERFNFDSPRYAGLREASRGVTAAYQDAAKILDTLKEIVLLDMGLVNTSNVIHNLAHEMPKRFDTLGDILHQRHLRQYYPSTSEYTAEPETLSDVFGEVINCLDAIENALVDFISTCDELKLYPFARQAETMQIENSQSYEKFLYAWAMFDGEETSPTSFDNWIMHLFDGGPGAED